MYAPYAGALGDFVHRVYPIELEMKDTTHTDKSASYLDLQLEIDDEGRLGRKHYDKRDDFNLHVVNQKLEHVEDISFR
jgi:hypothetical protein